MGKLATVGPVPVIAGLLLDDTSLYLHNYELPPRTVLIGPHRRKTDTGRTVKGSDRGEPWRAPRKTGRNDPCPCGSSIKFKNCRLKGLCKGEI